MNDASRIGDLNMVRVLSIKRKSIPVPLSPPQVMESSGRGRQMSDEEATAGGKELPATEENPVGSSKLHK